MKKAYAIRSTTELVLEGQLKMKRREDNENRPESKYVVGMSDENDDDFED